MEVWQHTELTSTNHSIGLILVLRTICLLALSLGHRHKALGHAAGADLRPLRLRASRPDAQSRLPKAPPLEK